MEKEKSETAPQPLSASKKVLKFTLYFLSLFFFGSSLSFALTTLVFLELVILFWFLGIVCFYFAYNIKNE